MRVSKWVLAIFLALIFLFFIRPIEGDGDFFHHLNTGKFILGNHTLPGLDNLTFSAGERPWTAHSWATGLIFYLIYSRTGPLGINLLVALIAVITFFLLFLWVRNYTHSDELALLLITLVALLAAIRWPARPEIFSYPFAISFFLIDLYKKRHPKIVLSYPLLTLLWANLYGGSIIFGLAILILLGVKQTFVDRGIKASQKIFYFSLLASFPASFLNGYGSKSVFFIFLIPNAANVLGEWAGAFTILSRAPLQVLVVFQYYLLIYFLYLFFFLLVLILALRKLRDYPFLAVLALALLAPLLSFRYIVLAVIFSAPLFGVLLSEASHIHKSKVLGVIMALCIGVPLILSFQIYPHGIGQDNYDFPKELIEYFKDNKLAGKVYNSQRIGSFLSYHLYPQVLVFYDTRDDLFLGTEALKDLYDTIPKSKSIIPLLEKYKADLAVVELTESSSYQPLFISEGWKPVFLAGRYAVVASEKVIKEKGLQAIDAINPYSSEAVNLGMAELAIKEYKTLLATQPDSFQIKLLLARALYSSGLYDDVIAQLATIKMPHGLNRVLYARVINFLLSQAYFSKGNCLKAKEFLDITQKNVKGKLIFSLGRNLPSQVNKGYAFYFLSCQRNLAEASKYLNLYLSQRDVSLSEKRLTKDNFEQKVQELVK